MRTDKKVKLAQEEAREQFAEYVDNALRVQIDGLLILGRHIGTAEDDIHTALVEFVAYELVAAGVESEEAKRLLMTAVDEAAAIIAEEESEEEETIAPVIQFKGGLPVPITDSRDGGQGGEDMTED